MLELILPLAAAAVGTSAAVGNSNAAIELHARTADVVITCSRHGFLHQRMNANGSDTK
jgi:hypothetical protein